MLKRITPLLLVVLSSSVLAEDQFYYFAKKVDDQLIYTRVLRCGNTSVRASDSTFTASNAVGPFSNFQEAQANRSSVLNRAEKSGVRVKLSEAKCSQ